VVDTLKGEAFGFLGFDLHCARKRKGNGHYLRMTPKKKACKVIKAKLRDIIRHSGATPMSKVVAQINASLAGWVNYFRVGNASGAFSEVRQYAEMKVRTLLTRRKRRRKTSIGWRRWSNEYLYGVLGMYWDWKVQPLPGVETMPWKYPPPDTTHNPFDEAHWVRCLRENFTNSSYGEGLETGRTSIQTPRQSLTRQNRIKELHDLQIDRTSCSDFWADQFRVLLTAADRRRLRADARVASAGRWYPLRTRSSLDAPRTIAEAGCPRAGLGRPRGRAPTRVVPVSTYLPASDAGARRLAGIVLPRSTQNIIFGVMQTAVRGSTVPENLHACQLRQTSDLHNSPHWTIHAAISTIAAISSLRSPPRQPSCIKRVSVK